MVSALLNKNALISARSAKSIEVHYRHSDPPSIDKIGQICHHAETEHSVVIVEKLRKTRLAIRLNCPTFVVKNRNSEKV